MMDLAGTTTFYNLQQWELLVPNVTYLVSVTANNEIGDGPASEAIPFIRDSSSGIASTCMVFIGTILCLRSLYTYHNSYVTGKRFMMEI